MSTWSQGLNPEQVQAVRHNHGPLLILAGAGSGKTTVLVSRTGRLIAEGIAKPEEICVLTFTNKAARELKHRVAQKLGDSGAKIWAGTFHSFGLQILRQFHKEAGLASHFGVIDQSDSTGIIRELLKEVRVVGKDKFDLDKILNIINERRIRGRAKLEGFDEYHEVAEMLLPKFTKKLELLGVVDFEGLLLKPLELFQSHPEVLHKVQNRFKQVMVDEFQDTNETQMKLVKKVIESHRNISVVGDDDQSIYGWRGAQIANILNFPKEFTPCQVIKLEKNYRCSPAILTVANEVISKNKVRHGKILTAEGKFKQSELPELFLIENDEEEAEFIGREIQSLIKSGRAPQDVAVLYRSNTQGGMIESVMRRNQIPYTVSGGTAFFDRKEIKDILAYLRLSMNMNDVGLRRIINTPNRGIGDTTIEKLSEYAKAQKINFSKACVDWKSADIQEKAGDSINYLFEYIKSLPAEIMDPKISVSPGQNLLTVLSKINYKEYIQSTSSEPHVAEKRWTLVEIFSRVLDSFAKKGGMSEKTLREFVDAMELRDDQNEEDDRNKVSLMTLHACKGLEFPVVFIVGVEEDLLPHKNLGSDVDEERRLFYVGVTRAKERLVLSRCKTRKRHGQLRPVTASRFLLEIPKAMIRDYQGEFRPVTPEQRESLVSDFLANLGKK